MKKTSLSAAIVALSASTALAGGLDRSGQSISAIFNDTGTANVSFGSVTPKIKGRDKAGAGTYSVGESYSQIGLSYTGAINDKLNYAVIMDQPFGADINYDSSPLTTQLGGTKAELGSTALTFVGRYRVSDRFSVFAGIGVQQVDANITLNGIAYRNSLAVGAVAKRAGVNARTLGAALQPNPARAQAIAALGGAARVGALGTQVQRTATGLARAGGYQVSLKQSTAPNFVIGAAYEIPDIAFRVSGAYRFETEHEADATENFAGTIQTNKIKYKTPASFNLDFQTGIAKGTLLTAGLRWTEFSKVDLVPTLLGSDLVNVDDTTTYSLGLARQFSDALVASVTFNYEPEDSNKLKSPLGPTNGSKGITIGARYSKDNMKISGGLNFTKLGDAEAEIAGVGRAAFSDNSAVGWGLKAEFTF